MWMKFRKFLALYLVIFNSISAINLSEKMYINDEDLDYKNDSFKIHIGHNVWIETDTIHRDETGLYTFENRIFREKNGIKEETQKKWKCPYCYQYWPIGTACQNKDCPSKYK